MGNLQKVEENKKADILKKNLKIIGIIAGTISALACIGLGYIYLKKLFSNLKEMKERIFFKINSYTKNDK